MGGITLVSSNVTFLSNKVTFRKNFVLSRLIATILGHFFVFHIYGKSSNRKDTFRQILDKSSDILKQSSHILTSQIEFKTEEN